MSAWIASPKHFAVIIAVCAKHDVTLYVDGAHQKLSDPVFAERVANVLYRENVRSVNHRYTDQTKAGKVAWGKHIAAQAGEAYLPIDAIKLLHSLDYQSCETDDYKTTEARAFNVDLIVALSAHLPGYDEAPWSV